MMLVRGILFRLLFYALTALVCLLFLPLLLLPRPALVWAVRTYLWLAEQLEIYVAGIRHRRLGQLPPGPFILAIQHQSAWETLRLHGWLGDPAIVLKRELLDLPFWGLYPRKLEMIPVVRGGGAATVHAMLSAARRAVAAGRPLAIFPQGTRVAPGQRAPYKAGVGLLYEALQIPVVPAALNSGNFWAKGTMPRQTGTITVHFLPPIPPGLPLAEFMSRLEGAIDQAAAALPDTALPAPE